MFVGIYCQKWYVYENENNYGLVQQCQQLMESYVQMLKRELRVKGNGLPGWASRLFNFADLYCVGAMAYDEINFYNIYKKAQTALNLIYDEYATRLIEEKMEYEMPDKFWHLLQLVEPIEPGDDIPNEIVNIMNGQSRAEERLYDNIGANHRRYANFFLADDVNEDDPHGMYPHLLPHQQPDRTERRPTRIQEMERQRALLRQNRQRNPIAAGISQ